MQNKNQPEEKKSFLDKLDASVVIALIAVLISGISVIISLQEAQIMMKQQETLMNQNEASVWPFLQNRMYQSYKGDTMVTFRYEVTNKGVGPAIIDDVKYLFGSEEMEQWDLYKVLQKKYGEQVNIRQTQNSSLNKVVLAPGESHTVITEVLSLKEEADSDLNALMSEIEKSYKLEYCYCSVYGKCWFVSGWDKVQPSEECNFREDIR